MHSRAKTGLFVVLMIVLLLPLVQHCLNFIDSGPVHGAYVPAQDTEFSFDGWWSSRFQEKKNKYENDNIGFRPDFIRLNCQIDYSLFDKLHFQWGEMGTNGCPWDGLYIEAYLGVDYIGHQKILNTLQKFKKIQDTLAALGKTIVLVHAPCKAYYYPDCFPDEYYHLKKGPTNLGVFGHIADSVGVNQINFNEWILSVKNKTSELLYPKRGIHWSLYAAALAADSLVKYIEEKRHIKMPSSNWEEVVHEKTARETDDDIGKQLNLIVPVANEIFSYPVITYPDENKRERPKAIYIGDSFLYQWYALHTYDHVNADWQMWYYFNTICNKEHPFGAGNAPHIKDIDWRAELLKTDYVVLLYTAKNLKTLGDGFIENAYDYFYPNK